MNWTIRAMRSEDREAVLQMMRDFYASPAVLTNGSQEIFEADVAACVGDNPFLEGYVFEDGTRPLGYAMVAKSFSTEFGKPCIWIEDLYLRPAERGRGIGSAFLALLFEKYPDCIFRLEAEHENEGAVRMYERCGFSVLPYLELKK